MVFTLVWVMHVVLRSREQGSKRENLESLNLSPKEVKRASRPISETLKGLSPRILRSLFLRNRGGTQGLNVYIRRLSLPLDSSSFLSFFPQVEKEKKSYRGGGRASLYTHKEALPPPR